MARAPVAAVEVGGIAAEQQVHAAREALEGRLDDEVDMRVHEAEGVARQPVTLDRGGDELEERDPVRVVAEDHHAVDAARVDMEEAAVGDRRARQAWHAATVAAGWRARAAWG
jgi:hypothetical protein